VLAMADAPVPPRPPLERQSSVDVVIEDLQVPGLKEGEQEMILQAFRELGFDTCDALADPDAALALTFHALTEALVQSGVAALRAGSVAIKTRKALAAKFQWASTPTSPQPSQPVASAEEVEQMHAEIQELRAKVGAVGKAADASTVRQLEKDLKRIQDRQKSDETAVGEGSQALAMLPASAREGGVGSQQVSERLQQHEENIAALQKQMEMHNERAAAEDERRERGDD